MIGDQVLIPTAHLVCGMAQPAVDQSLVNPFGGTVRREAVTGDVPAFDDAPSASSQRPPQMVVRLVLGDRGESQPLALPHGRQASG
jgi:hypothetical protein